MNTRHLPRLAAALLMAGTAPAFAVDNSTAGDDQRCTCTCDLPSGAVFDLIYDSRGYGCAALENRTCTVEHPSQPGLVLTGRLWGCAPMIEIYESAIPGGQGGWVADPGTAAGGSDVWQVEPLPGAVFHQQ